MKTASLREQVLQRVRSEIIAGASPPGTMYSVPTLAASLGVSSTPVREALLELTRAGLLNPLKNRGFLVKEPSLQELHDLFDLRELMELHAAKLAAQSVGHDLTPLKTHADQISRAYETGDIQAYLEADRAYHLHMLSLAGNELLTQSAMALRDRMRLYGISSSAGRARQLDSVPEHYEIIRLIEAREGEALEALMRNHIRAWQPIFVEALSRPTGLLPRLVISGGAR